MRSKKRRSKNRFGLPTFLATSCAKKRSRSPFLIQLSAFTTAKQQQIWEYPNSMQVSPCKWEESSAKQLRRTCRLRRERRCAQGCVILFMYRSPSLPKASKPSPHPHPCHKFDACRHPTNARTIVQPVLSELVCIAWRLHSLASTQCLDISLCILARSAGDIVSHIGIYKLLTYYLKIPSEPVSRPSIAVGIV